MTISPMMGTSDASISPASFLPIRQLKRVGTFFRKYPGFDMQTTVKITADAMRAAAPKREKPFSTTRRMSNRFNLSSVSATSRATRCAEHSSLCFWGSVPFVLKEGVSPSSWIELMRALFRDGNLCSIIKAIRSLVNSGKSGISNVVKNMKNRMPMLSP